MAGGKGSSAGEKRGTVEEWVGGDDDRGNRFVGTGSGTGPCGRKEKKVTFAIWLNCWVNCLYLFT